MIDLEVEVPARKYRDGWVVWNPHGNPCCGRIQIHVYPADLEEIECECGTWMLTPLGMRRAETAERVN